MLPESLLGSCLNGKYKLRKVLGTGGMGVVFEAENVRIGRQVAIKVLLPELAADEEIVRRFEREARAATEIGNPHIVEILDFDSTPDNLRYIVMEFLSGEPLSSAIHREGKLGAGRAVDVAGQILYALAAAHKAGIVHRDIKPENIFICKRVDVSWKGRVDGSAAGGRDFIKIVDFGISRFIRPEMMEAKITVTGSILGTPYYMSPEQARGRGGVDARSDIYSVGAVMYHMLSGVTPFANPEKEDEGIIEILFRVTHEDLQSIGELERDLPYGLVRAVEKAMAKNPADRFRDADAFIEAIRQYSGFTAADVFGARAPGRDVGTDRQRDLHHDEAGAPVGPLESGPSAQEGMGAEKAAKAEEKERERPEVKSTMPVFREKKKEEKAEGMKDGGEPAKPAAAERPAAPVEHPETPAPVEASYMTKAAGDTAMGDEAVARKLETASTFTLSVAQRKMFWRRAGAAFVLLAAVAAAGGVIYFLSRGNQGGEVPGKGGGASAGKAAPAAEEIAGWKLVRSEGVPVGEGKAGGMGVGEATEKAEEKKAQPPVKVTSHEPEVKTIKLKITSRPEGAWVMLDENPMGPAPLEREMKADGKNHRVSVTLDGYRPFEEEVTFSVEKGDVDLFAKLKREKKKSSKGEKREGEAAGEEVKKAIEEKKAPSAAKPAPPGEAEKKPGTGKKKKGEEIARDIDV